MTMSLRVLLVDVFYSTPRRRMLKPGAAIGTQQHISVPCLGVMHFWIVMRPAPRIRSTFRLGVHFTVADYAAL